MSDPHESDYEIAVEEPVVTTQTVPRGKTDLQLTVQRGAETIAKGSGAAQAALARVPTPGTATARVVGYRHCAPLRTTVLSPSRVHRPMGLQTKGDVCL